MRNLKCELCGKEIEGYHKRHVNYLMRVHMQNKHEKELKEAMKDV